MGVILTLLPIVILMVFVGIVGKEGLWHSLLTFFNVLTSAVLATILFEPAATWVDSHAPTYSYLIDILTLWGLFALFCAVMRLLTNVASKYKVLFIRQVDIPAGMLVSLWTGWIVVCFMFMSLHVAPLPRHSFGGAFQKTPESRMFFSMAPDRQWLAFVHKLSYGAFGHHALPDDPDRTIFDPEGQFILTYGARRATYETTRDLRVLREWDSGIVEQPDQVIDAP